jgi:hypothetical protein
MKVVVDSESAALVSTAATTLVALLTTDAWAQVKDEVGGLWRRFRPSHADTVEADLAEAREALAGGQAATGTLVTEWESRLGRLLAADPAAAGELARVTDVLARQVPRGERGGNQTVRQIALADNHSTVIQVGGDARIGRPC